MRTQRHRKPLESEDHCSRRRRRRRRRLAAKQLIFF